MGILVTGSRSYDRFGETVVIKVPLAVFTDMTRADEFRKAIGKQMDKLLGIWHDGIEVHGVWTTIEKVPVVVDQPAPKMKTWMVRNLIDGHNDRRNVRPSLIGILTYTGRLPIPVSCGPVDYNNVLCLNEIRTQLNGDMMLTPMSVVTIQGKELQKLKEHGVICLNNLNGNFMVQLLEEVPAVHPCGWCNSSAGYETETDGWERCIDCGGN